MKCDLCLEVIKEKIDDHTDNLSGVWNIPELSRAGYLNHICGKCAWIYRLQGKNLLNLITIIIRRNSGKTVNEET